MSKYTTWVVLRKLIFLFLFFGFLYYFTEGIFRTITSPESKFWELKSIVSIWMFPVGGLCGVSLGLINELKFFSGFKALFQTILGALTITLIEFISGVILNIVLGFNIWTYSDLPFNILGQVCLLFTFIWFLICPLVFYLDDVFRNIVFKEKTFTKLKYYYTRIITDFF